MQKVNRRLDEVITLLDSNREALRTTLRDVNPTFAAMRSRDDGWSAAQIVEHLAIVEDAISRLLAKLVRQARESGAPPVTSDESVIQSLDKFRITEVVEKITAPSNLIPATESRVEDSLAILEQKRADLKKTLTDSADIDLTGVIFAHRIFGDMNVYQWAVFTAQHEERHRRQIEKTLDEVTERAAECAPIM